ncbi:MAG: hypothetical protein N3D20_00275 [Candidatus Pacearchaeota archaeon]|nr:hypothetical protein [Candidatus Pacearchaeota archaeon]
MNKKRVSVVFCFIFLLVIISFVSASFSFKNENLQRTYVGGEMIKGFINISFSNENAHSLLTSNFNGTITLIELLKKNNFIENNDYICSRKKCEIDYKADEEINSLNLNDDDSKIIGFKLTGNNVEISSLKLSLATNADASCEREILIDVLDRNESFIQSTKKTKDICEEEYFGCFDENEDTSYVIISESGYCEKIELPPAPAYMIGAKVKNGTATAKLTMKLYDGSWNELGECELPKNSQNIEKLTCQVNYSNKEKKEFMICISSSSEDAEYQIRSEESRETCGTDNMGSSYNIDFEIFAKKVKFAPIGILSINETTFSEQNDGNNLNDYIDSYIEEKYERNCSNGCIIPFRIYGNSQTITKESATLKYREGSGRVLRTTGAIYSIEKEDAKITTKRALNINIEKAGFFIPLLSTAKQLLIYLDNKMILPKAIPINVTKGFDFDISPKEVSIGIVTYFNIITTENITSSKWNFGDGTIETFDGKGAVHKYVGLPIGTNEYSVEVIVTRKDGVISKKIFKIGIEPLSESAKTLLNISNSKITKLNSKINSYPEWIGDLIKTKLNFDNMNSVITKGKIAILNASTNDDYMAIINQMLGLEIPDEIISKEIGKDINPVVGFEKIETSAIEQISNKKVSSDKKAELKEAIIKWMARNANMKLEYEKIFQIDENGEKILLSKLVIDVNPKEKAYLIINYPLNSIKFNGNYSESAIGSFSYIPIKEPKIIEFAIMDNVNVGDLGIYLSPTIDKVYVQAEVVKEEFNWSRFITWMIVLFVIAFIIYIVMQEWYKRYYEKSLFKNKDDLYNLINFIYNAKKAGMKDEELRNKLSDAKWKGEQITYALRKAEGKRTGMWEIPIFKYWEQMEIKAEIAKRVGEQKTSAQQQSNSKMHNIKTGTQQSLLK